MKLVVATRADKNIKEMTDITFPIIRRFCEKWGADFTVLDHIPPIMSDDNRPHFRITKLYDLLGKYDRAISLDSDIVINKNCPNLFDEVPSDCIGTIFEDKGTRLENRLSKIRDVQSMFGDVNWKSGYVNTGVLVVSKEHKDIFTSEREKYYTKDGSDDVHIGYKINQIGFKIHELDHRFNHMTMFSEPECGGFDRFNSYIIHYAGAGRFDSGIRSRLEQIKSDVKKIWE